MKTLKSFTLLLLLALIMIQYSCVNQDSGQKKSDSKSEAEEIIENVKVVNVYNYSKRGLQVLKDVKDENSHLTFLQLGEIATFLGEKDSLKEREYHKIELSDGQVGWSRGKYLIPNAEPAAVISESPIYERTDYTTITSKKLKDIDLIAIIGEKDDWYQFVGINTIKKGWIKKGVVSKDDKDITMTVLAFKNVIDKDGNIQTDKVEEFLETAPYPESIVSRTLNAALEEKMMKDAAGETMEEEMESSENEM